MHPGSRKLPGPEDNGQLSIMNGHSPDKGRYENRPQGWFRRCGRSGLMLPAVSLGTWFNFGEAGTDTFKHQDEAAFHENARQMILTAFDVGITHIDTANIYGPPKGAAEERVGRIVRELPRKELIIATKAGTQVWPGPYGGLGSRKHLLTSLDESLKRLGLDHVDIFYNHCPDSGTPLEETLAALDHVVRSGKALYVGVSNDSGAHTSESVRIIERDRLSPLLIHQPNYSMLHRRIETELLEHTGRHGIGVICYCPLSKGLLTSKYIDAPPEHARMDPRKIAPDVRARLVKLDDHARQRGQTLSQMALAWALRDPRVTSALIGASRPEQIRENAAALENGSFTEDELKRIDEILG